MFAAGFLIAVPAAFCFECLVANALIFLLWFIYELVIVAGGEAARTMIAHNWRAFWILSEIFNAYMITALTEEICKYYTFRTIEHPDLIFLTGLTRSQQDESAVAGGVVTYPFGSLQVQKLNRAESFGSLSQYGGSARSGRSGRSRFSKESNSKLIERTGTTEEEFDEDESDVRTFRQKAMAITTAMISVAVGLACAENCLYVFLFGGAAQMDASYADENDLRDARLEKFVVLVFRSLFPIHALAAALQSINMNENL